jgi:integrase
METRKHSPYYLTLDDVIDYKLSDLVRLWNRMPNIIKKNRPNAKEKIVNRNLALISALYITGGRASEVSEIKLKDISFEDSWIYIRLINRKNKINKRKEIIADYEIEKPFIKWLVKYYHYRINQTDDLETYLFPMMQGDKEYNAPLGQDAIYRNTTRYVGINPHFFRKLRASHLLEYYGLGVKELQQYLGWSSVLSSEPYLRISKAGIKKSYLQHKEEVKKTIGESNNVENKI